MKDDLLTGIAAIAAHMGFEENKTYRLHRSGQLPTFVRGRTIYARKSEIDNGWRGTGAVA